MTIIGTTDAHRTLRTGDHFPPSDGGGEAVLQAELGLQKLVDAVDDAGDNGLRA